MHVLAKPKRSKTCRLVKMEGSLTEQGLEQGKRWTKALKDAAYEGRCLLLLMTRTIFLEITQHVRVYIWVWL